MTRNEQDIQECWDDEKKNLTGMNTSTCVI